MKTKNNNHKISPKAREHFRDQLMRRIEKEKRSERQDPEFTSETVLAVSGCETLLFSSDERDCGYVLERDENIGAQCEIKSRERQKVDIEFAVEWTIAAFIPESAWRLFPDMFESGLAGLKKQKNRSQLLNRTATGKS